MYCAPPRQPCVTRTSITQSATIPTRELTLNLCSNEEWGEAPGTFVVHTCRLCKLHAPLLEIDAPSVCNVQNRPEVLKLWEAPPRVHCWSFGGGSCFYEVPVLTLKYKQWILRWPKLAIFRCCNTPNNKNQVALLSQIKYFSYYTVERNYCSLNFVFIYRSNISYHFSSRIVRSTKFCKRHPCR